MKKRSIIILCGIFILILAILVISRKQSYTIQYEKNGLIINESYKKDLNMYYFVTEYKGKNYELALERKYKNTKKLISNVEIIEKDNLSCLYMKSNKINTYPVCFNGENAVAYGTISNELETSYKFLKSDNININSDNIKVNTTLNKNITIWNHRGYTYISKNKITKLEFLQNESYSDNHSIQVGKYIVIPNYDETYMFKSLYLIDLKTGKYKKVSLDYEINYDFYYLGNIYEKIYFVDKKAKIEYAFDTKTKKLEIISNNGIGKIYNNGWEEVSMIKLSSDNYHFVEDKIKNYSLENGKLYLTYYKGKNKILLSNNKVDKIIYFDNDNVYYISKDKLYCYSNYYNEVLLAEYSEWEFNKENTVYIY